MAVNGHNKNGSCEELTKPKVSYIFNLVCMTHVSIFSIAAIFLHWKKKMCAKNVEAEKYTYKIELHWGQNPLTCFLLLLLYHSYLIVASD